MPARYRRQIISPLMLLKKKASFTPAQRISQNVKFMTGGGRIFGLGVRITNASTSNIAGDPSASSISFDLSGCLYVTGSNGNSLGSLFNYYLDSGSGPVEILKTLAAFSPTSPWEPIPQRWRVNFGGTTISDARGSGLEAWEPGDVLTMELKASFASLLQIRPDCVFANIDEANDLVASPISISPVTNLYAPPVVLSSSIVLNNQVITNYATPVTEDGITLPTMYNCSTDLALPVTGILQNNSAQLIHTFNGVVNPGDKVLWSAGGIAIGCALYDLTIGTTGTLYGFIIAADALGPIGDFSPPNGELDNAYQVTCDTVGDLCIIRLGPLGDDQDVGNNNQIDTIIGGYGPATYVWNGVTKQYELTDPALTTHFVTSLGKKLRISATGLDDNLIPPGNDRDFMTGLGNWYNGDAARGTTNWESTLQGLEVKNDVGLSGTTRAVLPVTFVNGVSYTVTCDLVENNSGSLALLRFGSNLAGGGAIADDSRNTVGPMSVTGTHNGSSSQFFISAYLGDVTADDRRMVFDNFSVVAN